MTRPGRAHDYRADLAARRPAGPDELRLFIAVPLPPPVIEAVERLLAALPAPADEKPVRWVRTDGLHLTLRFLGATPPDRVGALAGIVDGLAAGAGPFDVTVAGGGAFPSVRRPRTLWLAISTGLDGLAGLAANLGDRLAAAGWPREDRPFKAHLTLARADGVRSGAATAAALVAAGATFSVTFRADRLTLFRSHTGQGPARYEVLHEALLNG